MARPPSLHVVDALRQQRDMDLRARSAHLLEAIVAEERTLGRFPQVGGWWLGRDADRERGRLAEALGDGDVDLKGASALAGAVYRGLRDGSEDDPFGGSGFDVDRPPGPCDPSLPFSVRLHNGCFPPTVGHQAVFATCHSPLLSLEQKWAMGCFLPEVRNLDCPTFPAPDCPDGCIPDGWEACEAPCIADGAPACPTELIPPSDVPAIRIILLDPAHIDLEVPYLVATAWRFIQHHVDLLLWVCCLLDPTRELANRTQQLVFALPSADDPRGDPLPIHLENVPCLPRNDGADCAPSSGNKHRIRLAVTNCLTADSKVTTDCGESDSELWNESAMCVWSCEFGRGSDADKCCTIIDVATMLVHELMNVVTHRYPSIPVERERRDPVTGEWVTGGCQAPYWIGAAFRWSALVRHSRILAVSCQASAVSPMEEPENCGVRP